MEKHSMYNTKRLRVFEYEGYTILVGKSDKDNDYLTFEVAGSYDLWLHVAGYSGSHVVICVDNGDINVPCPVIEYAVWLSHKYSKAKNIPSVEVHCCIKKNVSKPSGIVKDGTVNIDFIRVYKSIKNKYNAD